MINLDELKFYIEATHNVQCDIIDNSKSDSQIIFLVEDLTSHQQVEIEESISDLMGEDAFALPIVYDKQFYIDSQQTIILTKDDIARNCIDVPFNDVTMQMFPRKDMMKMLRAKKSNLQSLYWE